MSGGKFSGLALYPEGRAAREEWVVAHRDRIARRELDPWKPYEFLVEEERSAAGELVPVATVFLTNRECPWRCLMCDLWRNTLTVSVPCGAIPAQIDFALAQLPAARQIKLYNSGSFFDPRAIPVSDYRAIAERVASFERVIVESHPALVGENCWRFQKIIAGTLEVAMGLETVHPKIGPRLNKGVTLEQFARAAGKLLDHGVDLRVFVLATLPFLGNDEALEWVARSIEFAFDCGAGVVTIIPTRAGNGAMDQFAASGAFSPPTVELLEAATADGVARQRGRVFADLWEIDRLMNCPACAGARVARLRRMNVAQIVPPPVTCDRCPPQR